MLLPLRSVLLPLRSVVPQVCASTHEAHQPTSSTPCSCAGSCCAGPSFLQSAPRVIGWTTSPGVRCSLLAGAMMHAGRSSESSDLEILTAILVIAESRALNQGSLTHFQSQLTNCLVVDITRVHWQSISMRVPTLHKQNIPLQYVQVAHMMRRALGALTRHTQARIAPCPSRQVLHTSALCNQSVSCKQSPLPWSPTYHFHP